MNFKKFLKLFTRHTQNTFMPLRKLRFITNHYAFGVSLLCHINRLCAALYGIHGKVHLKAFETRLHYA